jgi:23S rRNA pseudouridine955/2504/2580 synthase
MKEIVIGENQIDKRLDSFLKSYLPNASTGFLYKMLRKKNITLNGKKAEGTEKLKKGDTIKIFFSDETFDKFKGKSSGSASKEPFSEKETAAIKGLKNIEVIYEDKNIVLLNKPAGILTQKAEGKDVSLNEWLIQYLFDKNEVTAESLESYRPSVCNRLDRNTSGIVICAKSLLGARTMNRLLKERDIHKFYRTIVKGNLSESLKLTGYLYKDEAKNKVFIKDKDPKDERYSYIETEYYPVSYNKDKDLTLLEVKLITGKPHQIRAHLSSISHPIIGDVKYGGPKIEGLKYQLLHSYRLVFPESLPEGMEELQGKEYKAKLPDIFGRIFGED